MDYFKQRDLSAGEMVAQVMKVHQDTKQRISHVVIMGTGEPFDNYDHVMEFARIINHSAGLAIGAAYYNFNLRTSTKSNIVKKDCNQRDFFTCSK